MFITEIRNAQIKVFNLSYLKQFIICWKLSILTLSGYRFNRYFLCCGWSRHSNYSSFIWLINVSNKHWWGQISRFTFNWFSSQYFSKLWAKNLRFSFSIVVSRLIFHIFILRIGPFATSPIILYKSCLRSNTSQWEHRQLLDLYLK